MRTRLSAEIHIYYRAYASQYGCNFTGIIPTNIYGPYDNFGDGSHFVPALIRKVQAAKGWLHDFTTTTVAITLVLTTRRIWSYFAAGGWLRGCPPPVHLLSRYRQGCHLDDKGVQLD